MATLIITEVTFNNPPASAVLVIFRYRSNTGGRPWTAINGGLPISVPISGVLTTPIYITGLDPDSGYEIGAQSTCGTVEFTVTATTAAEVCPNVTSIETLIVN